MHGYVIHSSWDQHLRILLYLFLKLISLATAISNNNGVLLQKQTPVFCRKISKPDVPVSWRIYFYFSTVKLSWWTSSSLSNVTRNWGRRSKLVSFKKKNYVIVLIFDWHQDCSCAARTPHRFQGSRSEHTSPWRPKKAEKSGFFFFFFMLQFLSKNST